MNRRECLAAAMLGFAVGLPRSFAQTQTQAPNASSPMKITPLHPPDAPAADVGYTPGLLVDGQRLILISGQGPKDLQADMETQFRQTFERIKVILEAAGGSMNNLVMLRAYFVHFGRDLPVYRKIRREYLEKPYPASTAVGVTELAPPGNVIEVEAVALL